MNSAFDTDDDRYAPDPDAVSIRIECDRDTAAEAYEAAAALQREARRLSEATVTPSLNDNTADVSVCPTCGGSGYVQMGGNDWRKACPTCHGTGTKGDS
jgi:DnaJ-class molecular chaperone